MRTNSKIVRILVKQYILETVYDDNEQTFKTFEDAGTHLKNDFERVANYPNNLKKFPNNQNRFLDYLQGCPFWFSPYTWQIEDFLDSLGINPENKKFDSEKVWNLYGCLIYNEISNL